MTKESQKPQLNKHSVTTSTFDNSERRRYYGLRIGDIVSPKGISGEEWYY